MEESLFSLPVYVSLLDAKDEVLETQYFSVTGSFDRSSETKNLIETDITDQLQIVTKYLNKSKLIIRFMLDDQKRDLLD